MNSLEETTQYADIKEIQQSVAADITSLNELIINSLQSDIPLIKAIIQHILNSGGKRLRPLLVLLLSNHFGLQDSQQHLELAAIIEFVHTATLLHDDVIDHSTLRRGESTANCIWGNHAPILVGDFLYSRAFQLLASRSNPPVMRKLALTTNILAEGEIMQLANQCSLINETAYFDIIYRKTASLFETASECSAIIANQPPSIQQACAQFGKHLGIIFQITDDLLDYTAKDGSLGKNIGDDINEGKATLPLIYAFEEATTAQRHSLSEALNHGEPDIQEILDIINSTSSLQRCQECIQQQAEQAQIALSPLGHSHDLHQLESLLQFAVNRQH